MRTIPIYTVFVDFVQTVQIEVEAESEAEAREFYRDGDEVGVGDPEPMVSRVVLGHVDYRGPHAREVITP